jgi:3-hydroxyisobutyrate dehydrogenase
MARPLAVGFIGIGTMGWPMAANLVKAGHAVRVSDADAARAARFAAEHGVAAAEDPAALGRAADVIITMLPDGAQVRQALTGTAGGGASLLSGLRPGSVVVDMSSSDPLCTRELGAVLRAAGVRLVDAPVSGLAPKAQAGTLTIMVGADDDAELERVRPLLEAMGERLFRCGPLGCGHAMKALNNVVAATAFTATAEALIVGRRFGLDPAVMTRILNVSTGRSFHSDMSFPDHVLTRRFASGFTLGLLAKDVGIAADLAAGLQAETPLIALVRAMWAEGGDEIGPAEDNSAIVRRWERVNGVTLEAAPAADSDSR